MYGDHAAKLVNEAKRAQNLESLALFQDELIRSIVKETKDLDRQKDMLGQDEFSDRADQAQVFVTHLCMRQPELTNHNEIEYFKAYSDILIDYKSSFAEVDLSGSLVPPKDVFIDVRVIKDAGEIQTEYGVFNLTKDSQFFRT
ncbi:unnamed protein product [Wickerhamomyces anomalus]